VQEINNAIATIGFMMGTSEDCSNYLQIKIKGEKRANKRIGALPLLFFKRKNN
jgi:hypothetical protein